MKGHFIILIIPILFLGSCQSGKYSTDFKSIKKSIDTLVILPTNVEVKVRGENNRIDIELSKQIGQHLSEKIISLLKSKYNIIHDSAYQEYSVIVNNEISELNKLLKVKENPIDNVIIPQSMEELAESYDNNFILLIYFRGFYTSGIDPFEKASRDVVYLSSPNYGNMSLFIILFNKSSRKVLFFEESLAVLLL